jgi:hypothetical protein
VSGIGALTETEAVAVLHALARGTGSRGFTTSEAQALLDWAESVRVDAAILRLILDGEMRARWSAAKDDWEFQLETDGSGGAG